MLISVLCDYSDAYIVAKGRKFVEGDNDDKTRDKKLIFKNNGSFKSVTLYSQCWRSWDSYTNVLNIVTITLWSLLNYHRDEINADENENNANKTITSKSFEYKIKIIGRTRNYNTTLDKEAVPLKYLVNFLRFLDLWLIKCKIELGFPWPKEFITFEISI